MSHHAGIYEERQLRDKDEYGIRGADTILVLAQIGGAVASVTRKTFTKIEWKPEEQIAEHIVPSAQRKALTARRDSINVPASTSLHPFLSALGAGVAQISLTRPELLRKAVRHVASFCTGLRHLSIELDSRWQSGRLRTLLAARGAELEVLEVEISDILSVYLVAGI